MCIDRLDAAIECAIRIGKPACVNVSLASMPAPVEQRQERRNQNSPATIRQIKVGINGSADIPSTSARWPRQ